MALLLVGVLACSTSVLFIKESTLDPIVLSALRLWVAAAALTPLYARARSQFAQRAGSKALWPGLLLAAHFISWISGARMTPAVNSTLLVNLVPLVTPFLLLILAGERLGQREVTGTAVATVGVAVLVGTDYELAPQHFTGDIVCFASMALFASYLVLGRRHREIPDLALYLVPLYGWGALTCTAFALATVDLAREPWNTRELTIAVALGVVPGVVGHGLLNRAMKYLRGQVVSITNLAQPLAAGLMAIPVLGEIPPPRFYPAAALICAGALFAVTHTPKPATGASRCAPPRASAR